MKIFCFFLLFLLSGTLLAQEGGLPQALDPLESSYGTNAPEPLMRFGYGYPYHVHWLPDGETLAVGTSAGVAFYDSDNLDTPLRFISTAPDSALQMTFSSDGKFMATGKHMVQLWDVTSGERLEFLDTEGIVGEIMFSPDNRLLGVMEQWRHHIGLWDVATGRFIKSLATDYYINDVAFANQSVIIKRDFGDLVRLDIETGELSVLAEEVDTFALSPDGSSIVYAPNENQINTIELATGAMHPRAIPSGISPSDAIAIYWTNDILYRQGKFYRFDQATLELLEEIPAALPENIYDSALSPDGSRMAVLEEFRKIYVFDTHTGEIITSKEMPGMAFWTIALSQDGTLLAGLEGQHEIIVWNLVTGEEYRRWTVEGEEILLSLAFGDSNTLISGDEDGRLIFWDLTTLEQKATVLSGARVVKMFSNYVDELLVVTSVELKMYDPGTAKPTLLCNDPQTNQPQRVRDSFFYFYYSGLDYDGTTLVMAGGDKVYRWNRIDCTDKMVEAFTSFMGDLYFDVDIRDFIIYTASSRGVVEGWISTGEDWVVIAHSARVTEIAAEENFGISASCVKLVSLGYGEVECMGAELRLSHYLRQGDYDEVPVLLPPGHSAAVRVILIDAMKRFFVTTSEDGTMIVWGNRAP